MQYILNIVENSIVAVLTIAGILLGIYAILVVLEWGMRIKSRGREQEGLTRLWAASQKRADRGQNENREEPDR